MLFPTYFPWFISPIKWKNPPNLVDSHLVKLLEKCGVDQPSSVSLHAASADACPTRRLGVERGPCEGNATLHGTRGGDAPWQGPALQGNSSVMLTHAGRVLTTLRAEFTSEQLAWTAILDPYTPGSSQALLLPRVKMLTSVDRGSGPHIYSHGPLGSVFI